MVGCMYFVFLGGAVLLLVLALALNACHLMRATAVAWSNAVDLYNSITGAWSTALLSEARSDFAAASVGNVAIFAGGWSQSAQLWIE